MAAFHEATFPLALSMASAGGPTRRTEIVTLASGAEERNSLWAHSRRRYDAGAALRSVADVETLLAFWEERRGRLHGFRWRDFFDHRSCAGGATPTALDQALGTGDGATAVYQLRKRYGASFAPYHRPIRKPVPGTIRVAVAGVELAAGEGFAVDTTTGLVTLTTPPLAGQAVTAGFLFDTPVRFDADELLVDIGEFKAGRAPTVPVLEVRL